MDILGLLLAILTAVIAAVMVVWLPALAWPTMGIRSLPFALAMALLVLAVGAAIHAALSPNRRS